MKVSILVAASVLSVNAAAQATASHCAPAEQVIWSCSAKEKVYSLCASKDLGKDSGYLQYRAGPVGTPEFLYPSQPQHPKGHFTSAMLTDGASVSFSNGQYAYEIIEPLNGRTAIAVSKNNKNIANIQCAVATNTLTETDQLTRFKLVGIAEQTASEPTVTSAKPNNEPVGEAKIGLKGFYLGQPMRSCPNNAPPSTGTFARVGTTCEISNVSTLAGQPVFKFFVSFADGRVFFIMALLEGGKLETRAALSEAYGKPQAGPDADTYLWKFGENAMLLQSEGAVTSVSVLNGPDYKRQRQLAAQKNKGDL